MRLAPGGESFRSPQSFMEPHGRNSGATRSQSLERRLGTSLQAFDLLCGDNQIS